MTGQHSHDDHHDDEHGHAAPAQGDTAGHVDGNPGAHRHGGCDDHAHLPGDQHEHGPLGPGANGHAADARPLTGHTDPALPHHDHCGHAHGTNTAGAASDHGHHSGHGHDHGSHSHAGHSHHGHDHHGHDHDHDHGIFGHHSHAPTSFGAAFAIGIALNSAYLIGETIWGVFSHSLALLADAGHNLSDVLALAAAWLAASLARRAPSARFTYGLRRSSILAALTNAVVLLLVTGGIAWEAIQRLFSPQPVAGMTVMVVAAIGILVNGGTALLFMSGQKEDLNVKGAFMHMAVDAMASFAVVVAGALVMLTGRVWLDPTISLLLSVLIVLTTWSLLRDSLDMALDGVPRGVDRGRVEMFLRGLPGVIDLHDLHIWPMSTTETALTAHLVRDAAAAGSDDAILRSASRALRDEFGIIHPTLQIESAICAHECALADQNTI